RVPPPQHLPQAERRLTRRARADCRARDARGERATDVTSAAVRHRLLRSRAAAANQGARSGGRPMSGATARVTLAPTTSHPKDTNDEHGHQWTTYGGDRRSS